MTEFKVDSQVTLGPPVRRCGKDALSQAWSQQGKLEAVETYTQDALLVKVFSERNMLAEAVNLAFYEHYPLVLTPDVIWLAIMQGLGKHVDANAEELRSKFVDFKGKADLVVTRPEFEKGSADNDWPSVFPEFCSKIGAFVGEEMIQVFEADFTTTTATSKIASQITIMDTVKHYFNYIVMMGCGIPSITLKGTPDDWQKVREKASKLKAFDMDWWLSELLPVLDQFVAASQGEVDRDFWRSVCNISGASGMISGPMTGWLQVFFPYLNNSEKSTYGLGAYKQSYKAKINVTNFEARGFSNGCGSGIQMKNIPPSLSKAPFTLQDLRDGQKYDMLFMSGITGVIQYPDTLALEPIITWAVLEVDPKIEQAKEAAKAHAGPRW
eukprot:m.207940 g.207940  ORF g.207940 m.207940 type:complete len:382 (+) comp17125_c2_seq2:1449-2594(+)